MTSLSMAVVALVALLAVTCGPPAPSPEARQREQILLDLPVRDLSVPGGELLNESSDPGHRDDGGPFFGRPVEVRRTYSYTGEPLDVCDAIADELERFGWIPGSAGDCRRDFNIEGQRRQVGIQGRLWCATFGVGVDIAIYTEFMPNENLRGTVALTLSAPYPGDEPDPPVPPDVEPMACDAGGDS